MNDFILVLKICSSYMLAIAGLLLMSYIFVNIIINRAIKSQKECIKYKNRAYNSNVGQQIKYKNIL